MDDRTQRIKLLSRINRANAAAPALLGQLSEVLGEPVQPSALLPVLDAVQDAFRTGYQTAIKGGALAYRRMLPCSERSTVFRIVDCFASSLPAEEVFFLCRVAEDRGVVSLNLSVLLRHAASLIRFDGDFLSAMSKNLRQGVLIDHNPDDQEEAYEIIVWGELWPLLVLACDPK